MTTRRNNSRAALLRTALAFGTLALLASAHAACNKTKKDPKEAKPLPMANTSSSGERYAAEQPCENPEEIVKPADNSLEKAVQTVLSAATAEGDDEANFDKFYGEFSTTTPKNTMKSFLWKSAKKHAKKYLVPGKEKDVAFTICRRVPSNDGKIKVFLRSYDDKKLNTPMTLKKGDDGSYKVTSYSP